MDNLYAMGGHPSAVQGGSFPTDFWLAKLGALMTKDLLVSLRMHIFLAVFWTSLLAWRIYRFTLRPRLYPHEAKELPYWIPLLGHALQFFRDADGMFTQGREYFNNTREPFSITVAGEKVYVITNADDVVALNKNSADFTFDAYVQDMMHAFKASPEAVSRVWERPSRSQAKANPEIPNPSLKPHLKVFEDAIKKQLSPGVMLDKVQDVLLSKIIETVTWENMSSHVIAKESGDSRVVSLTKWTQDSLLAGATKSFFGDSLLQISPRIFDNFFEFDEKSWKLNYRVPRPFSDDMRAPQESTLEGLTAYFELAQSERQDACWLVTTLEGEMRRLGIGSSDIAAYMAMFYWVMNANSWKVCLWAMSRLAHEPALIDWLRTEAMPIYTSTNSPNELASSLSHCPRLMSFFQEVMRTVTSSVSVRDVMHKTVLGGKTMSPGNRVVIPYRQMLMDDQVFGKDFAQFRADRFLNNEGLQDNLSYRPFGIGKTYCPGRHIATNEVLTFVAVAVCRFDLELADKNEPFPELDTRKPTLGIMAPVEGHDCTATIRSITSPP